MRWKIVLEGTDEFGSAHRPELTIDKDMKRLLAGEIGFSVEDGKAIMAHLQQVVVNQQCEAYVLTSRFCTDCEGFRRIKDYSKRKIRTVFGCVEVRNPRIMDCQRCLPLFCDAWTVLRDICPDQAPPELMERSARLFWFRFGPPFSTAIFGSASRTSRRTHRSRIAWMFEPTPPLLKTA